MRSLSFAPSLKPFLSLRFSRLSVSRTQDSSVPAQFQLSSSSVPAFILSWDYCSNYRPISILSVVSKLLERHVHHLLLQHLNAYPCYSISSRQWGFLPGRSTASALLSVTYDWLQQLELGNEVCSVFFDLKKAFDSTVSHTIFCCRDYSRSILTHSLCNGSVVILHADLNQWLLAVNTLLPFLFFQGCRKALYLAPYYF